MFCEESRDQVLCWDQDGGHVKLPGEDRTFLPQGSHVAYGTKVFRPCHKIKVTGKMVEM